MMNFLVNYTLLKKRINYLKKYLNF